MWGIDVDDLEFEGGGVNSHGHESVIEMSIVVPKNLDRR